MKIILTPGTGEVEEKKSRFIATLRAVNTEEEALAFFDEMRKKYWDARHNCTAFVIGKNAELTRCSDDGEPSQTAGRPMLNVLLHHEVRNVACVVTRYFGGTLLGTGGLIKAYSEAVADALKNSVIGEETEGILLLFTVDYVAYGKVQYEFGKRNLVLENGNFSDRVRTGVRIPKEKEEEIRKLLTEITFGTVEFGEPEECRIITEIPSEG